MKKRFLKEEGITISRTEVKVEEKGGLEGRKKGG
jgi:hypothetical protein